MKKVFISVVTLAAVVLSGCSVMDLFVDSVAVHNGLVAQMNRVLNSEEAFFDQYWALGPDVDTQEFLDAHDDFGAEIESLELYFTDTRFASHQLNYIDEYNEYYKGFLTEYMDYAGEFKDKVVEEGFTYEGMEPYFEELDQYTVDFVDMHNRLSDTINVNADTAVQSQGFDY